MPLTHHGRPPELRGRWKRLLRFTAAAMVGSAAAMASHGQVKGTIEAMCDEQTPAGERLAAELGDYYQSAISEGLEPEHVRITSGTAALRLLDEAAHRNLGLLELFTDSQFSELSPCSFLITRDVLERLEDRFALHALWKINAEQVISRQPVLMKFLLLGKGRLVLGYSRAGDVRVPDYSYLGISTYRYAPYISARIVSSDKRHALEQIRAKFTAEGPYGAFSGPLLCDIESLALEGGKVVVGCKGPIGRYTVGPITEMPITSR